MLVCHKMCKFQGVEYDRGDTVKDPAVEKAIRSHPTLYRRFTPAVHDEGADPEPTAASTTTLKLPPTPKSTESSPS